MEAEVARLEANVDHIQKDAAEIKEGLKYTNVRIDEVTPRLEKIRDRIDYVHGDLGSRITHSQEAGFP